MNNILKVTTSREDGNHHVVSTVTEGESDDMDHDNNTSSTTKKKSNKDKKRKHSRDEDSLLLNGSKNGHGSDKKRSKKNKDRREDDEIDTNISSTADTPNGGLQQKQSIASSKQTSLSPPIESEMTRPRSTATAASTSTVRPMIASLVSTSTAHAAAAAAATISSKQQLLLLKKSPYKLKTIQGTVALLPSSLPDVSTIIKSRLNALLLMYDSNMGGVLLSLEEDVRLLPIDYLSPSPNNRGGNSNNNSMLLGGRIINDLPYIHYRYEVNGLVFCPTVGMKMKGQVVECTPTFITLTTHYILSTKISTEKLHEQGFFYNSVSMEWMRERRGGGGGETTTSLATRSSSSSIEGGGTVDHLENNLGRQSPSTSIYLDDIVEFVVDRIHECGGYISLDGTRPSVSTG